MGIIRFKFHLLIFIFFAACVTVPKISRKELLLEKHLSSWKNIRIDGIIEVNYKGFSFRKNVVFRKVSNIIRLDVYDSGLFGLSPTPFLTAYFDSTLKVRLPNSKDIIEIEQDNSGFQFSEFSAENISQEINRSKKEIIQNNFFQNENFRLDVDPEMRISELSVKDFKIQMIYQNEALSEILIYEMDKIFVKIIVDKIDRQIQEIEKIQSIEEL